MFGQTFADLSGIVDALRAEESDRRDICIYPRDPHVLVGLAPDELFIDPSYTYRLDLYRYRPRPELIRGVFVRTVTSEVEMELINDLYARNGMVVGDTATMWRNHRTRTFTYLVAEDRRTGRVVGAVTGVDHELAFGDPEAGTSLWCLAVHAQDAPPGTGEALVRVLAERYVGRGRAYLDLSVMHDNDAAIALYRKLGFTRVAAVCVKRKNPINTPLYAARPPGLDGLNAYSRIIADEALRRGIRVEVTDADSGELRLSMGGRTVLTLRVAVGVHQRRRPEPVRRQARHPPDHGARRGPGRPRGRGRRRATWPPPALCSARSARWSSNRPAASRAAGSRSGSPTRTVWSARSRRPCSSAPTSWSRSWSPGEDLRVIVIDRAVIAAAVRRPAEIVGDGRHTVTDLIRSTSRAARTGDRRRVPDPAGRRSPPRWSREAG